MSSMFDYPPEKRATQAAFFKRQLFHKPPIISPSEVNLTGRTAIVTGSNIGLGFECSRQLLDLGLSRLILAVRSVSKGEAAREILKQGRSAGKHVIEVWHLDLSTYSSITDFVERAKTLDRLDIFVHNAGIVKSSHETNKMTGHEEGIQVNYLSLALLTILILPVLKDKNAPQQPGRLVLVSSDTASWPKFKEQDSPSLLAAFDNPDFFDPQDRYWTTKLLGQFFLSELVKLVPASVAVINAPNPGLCYGSGLQREFSGTFVGFAFDVFKRVFGRSPAVGARALTDAGVKHGSESHGIYIEDGKLAP